MTPQRIQLSRRRGYRKPPGAIVCTRPHSPYANPDPLPKGADDVDRLENVLTFALKLTRGKLEITVDDVRRDLRGRDLACWCGLDEWCHVDVLLAVANDPDPFTIVTRLIRAEGAA